MATRARESRQPSTRLAWLSGVGDDQVVAAGEGGQDADVGLVAASGRRGRRDGRGTPASAASSARWAGRSPETRREAEAPKPSARRRPRRPRPGQGGKPGRDSRSSRTRAGACRRARDATRERPADLGAGAAAVDGGERLQLGLQHGANERTVMYHVRERVPRGTVPRGTVSRGDRPWMRRAAAVEVDARGRAARAGRRRRSARRRGRRAGPAARPAPATSSGASVAREIATSNAARRSAISPATRLAARDPDRRPVAEAELADRGSQERRLLGDRLAAARPSDRGRSSASGIAGRPPPLPTSTSARRLLELARQRERVGEVLARPATSIDARRGQVDARVPAQQQTRRSSTSARDLGVVARETSTALGQRAHELGRPSAVRRSPRRLVPRVANIAPHVLSRRTPIGRSRLTAKSAQAIC